MNPAGNLLEMTAHLDSGLDLVPESVALAADALLDEQTAGDAKAGFLRALRKKGETAVEIAAFVRAFLRRAVNPELDPTRRAGPMIDVCGTGGDRMDIFNVSTTSMFVLAAGGAVVVKHGNRGITSKCGGADVLEALGIRIDLTPAEFRRCVEEAGLGFMFAPSYHPAFKVIAPIRRQLAEEGIPTIFNLLGPLLNPAQPAHQLVGIYSRELLPKYAEALRLLDRRHAWAVHGSAGPAGGLDEMSTMGPTEVCMVRVEGIVSATIDPAAHGFVAPDLCELRGGEREENARILLGILDGTITGPRQDVVVLNAAAGFVVAELATDLGEGIRLAREQIASGRALEKLRALQRCSR